MTLPLPRAASLSPFPFLRVAAVALAALLLHSAPRAEAREPDDSPSPEAQSTGSYDPGLTERALPVLTADPVFNGYIPLYRLTRPYYDEVQATREPPQFLPAPDPASFRPVLGYDPPIGLLPKKYKPRNFLFDPWAGLSQSYDSNVNLSAHNRISDFYVTPRAGFELQYGTPDSAYLNGYETLVAVHANYETYEDIFYDHPELDAYNQKLDLIGRIGRADAIWRPYINTSDITGTDLLTRDLTNRTERERISTGVQSQYNVTSVVGIDHTLGYYNLQHPDQSYNNLNAYRSLQEVTYQSLQNVRTLVWTEYRSSQPDRDNDSGSETMAGIGWMGKIDPRLYTEMRLGWDQVDLAGSVDRRKTMNPIRFNGYSTFDWSDRFRLTLRYDRDYVFNELGLDDNYLSTLIQVKGEFYLGGNWFVTPYFGVETDEFETSHNVDLNWRPEVEISYNFPGELHSLDSRIYFKIGYERSDSLNNRGEEVDSLRASIGTTWRF
jgi:hypothetical protein